MSPAPRSTLVQTFQGWCPKCRAPLLVDKIITSRAFAGGFGVCDHCAAWLRMLGGVVRVFIDPLDDLELDQRTREQLSRASQLIRAAMRKTT